MQRRCWHRLHLFPDEEMPGFIRKNISHQLEQIQNIPKKSTEYTNEERRRFPRLFKFSDEHVLNRHDNAEPLKWYCAYAPFIRSVKARKILGTRIKSIRALMKSDIDHSFICFIFFSLFTLFMEIYSTRETIYTGNFSYLKELFNT